MLASAQGSIHFRMSNLPDVVALFFAAMSTCPITTGSHLMFWFLRSSSKLQSTSSCDRMPVSWLLASTTVYLSTGSIIWYTSPRLNALQDIAGRRLFLFENSEGKKNIWYEVCSYPFVNRLNKFGSIWSLDVSFSQTAHIRSISISRTN